MSRRAPTVGQRSSIAVRSLPGALPGRRRDARAPRTSRPSARPTRSSRRRASRSIGARGSIRSRGSITLRDYSSRWLAERVQLRPRTRELYEGLLRLHILPVLGDSLLVDLTPARVRAWHADAPRGRHTPGPSTTAKAYRLLRTMLGTAVEDGILDAQPVHPEGRGHGAATGATVATIEQVYALADAIEPQFRVLVLTATFTGLRLGELHRRCDARTSTCCTQPSGSSSRSRSSTTAHATSARRSPTPACAPSRSPRSLVPELEAHLARFSAPGADGLVFPGTTPPADATRRRCSGLGTAHDTLVGLERLPLPRSAAHREHARGSDRREHEGAHGAHGPRVSARSADLPARGPRARHRDRRRLSDAIERVLSEPTAESSATAATRNADRSTSSCGQALATWLTPVIMLSQSTRQHCPARRSWRAPTRDQRARGVDKQSSTPRLHHSREIDDRDVGPADVIEESRRWEPDGGQARTACSTATCDRRRSTTSVVVDDAGREETAVLTIYEPDRDSLVPGLP